MMMSRRSRAVITNAIPFNPVEHYLLLCVILLICFGQRVDASQAAGIETLIGIVGDDFILLGADTVVSQSIAVQTSSADKIALIVNPFPQGRTRRRNQARRLDDAQPQQRYDGDASSSSSSSSNNVLEQQTIAVAAAGDTADTARLVELLKSRAALLEYEIGVGSDVQIIDCSSYDPKSSSTSIGIRTLTPASLAGLSVHAAARMARSEISGRLRSSQSPLQVCLLVAGMMPIVSDHSTERTATTKTEDLPLEVVQVQGEMALLQETLGSTTTTHYDRLQRQVREASSAFVKYPTTGEDYRVEATLDVNDETPGAASDHGPYLQPRLYWLDEYGSIQNLQYGAHGYGSNFCLSILDQGYRPHLTRSEAVELMRHCFKQLRSRFVINSQPPERPPCIKCIDADGCTALSP